MTGMAIRRKNVLILDPDRDTSELFARALESRRDCKCYLTSREEEAVSLLKEVAFDLLLMDLGTVMAADFGLLKRIRRAVPGALLVVDAYLHQKEQVQRAIALGANGYFIKPIKVDELRRRVDGYYGAAKA